MPQWLQKPEKPQIFLCAGCVEQRHRPALGAGTPWLAGWEEQSQQLSYTMSSQAFSTDRRATAYGDLHHQLLVSITPKQGFSKAKGFQLHHTSPPRAAAQHKEGPFAGGFHPFLSQSHVAVGHCELMHPSPEEAAFHPCGRGRHCRDQFPKNSKAVGEQTHRWRVVQGKAQPETPAAAESKSRAENCTLGLADGGKHPSLPQAVTAR